MALSPFWMDDLFAGGPKSFVDALTKCKRFQAALAKAEATFLETQDTLEKNPEICGAGAEQAACRAFLASMGLCIAD